MGKGIVIVALGVATIITALIMNLNENSTRGLQTSVDFFNVTQARLIADSGIDIYLEKLRTDKTLTGTFLDNSLMGGTYDVYISGPDSQMTIRTVGKFNDVTHTVIVSARRKPITIPNINSSLYTSTNNLGLNLSGNMTIDGNDHNTDGTAGPGSALPGITVDTPPDSAYIINQLKPNITGGILGQGGSPSVRAIPNPNDWANIAAEFISAADNTISSGTYSDITLGTDANPQITYAKGDIHFSGTAKGSGIMIVDGDLDMSGNFTFNGIIIVYGPSNVETKTTGNAGVYGATIFVGNSVDMKATGNSKFIYSSQAINNAKANLKSTKFEIESWWE